MDAENDNGEQEAIDTEEGTIHTLPGTAGNSNNNASVEGEKSQVPISPAGHPSINSVTIHEHIKVENASDVQVETFLPEFAAEGRAVNMNLAIGVRNPSQAIVEELQGATASSNNEDVAVPAATNDPTISGSAEGQSSKQPDEEEGKGKRSKASRKHNEDVAVPAATNDPTISGSAEGQSSKQPDEEEGKGKRSKASRKRKEWKKM
ncbi:uncharacterized protein [Branchiostoma lanceolatum]|uniref:uncharacterized protein n=1 Tax=Branchiostoma lanceolatum TaxID=7740 RepID=UPI0034556A0C